MTEPRVDCVTAASEAIRAEQAQVRGIASYLLGVVHDMNFPPIPLHVWRAAIAQVAERLGEVVNG